MMVDGAGLLATFGCRRQPEAVVAGLPDHPGNSEITSSFCVSLSTLAVGETLSNIPLL
jgi:hypothetical protein